MNHVVDKNISVAVRRKKFYRGGGPTIEPTGGDVAEPTRNHFSRCVALATISPAIVTRHNARAARPLSLPPLPVSCDVAGRDLENRCSKFTF